MNWLDIGSNDGSLLDIVYNSGIHATYGIEPSEEQYLLSISKNKHQISKGYACPETFQALGNQNFDVITIFNTLSNCIDPVEIVRSSIDNLADDGLIAVSTGDLFAIINGNIDYVYHEHNHYFSVNSLKKLCEILGMKIVKLAKNKQKGGSIFVVFSKINSNKYHDLINQLPNEKTQREIDYSQIDKVRNDLMAKILQWENEGRLIVAFGASQSSTTFMHYFGFEKYAQAYIDDNPEKLFTYSPLGNRIVISTEFLKSVAMNGKKIGVIPAGWRFIEMWKSNHNLQVFNNIDVVNASMLFDHNEQSG